MLVPRVTLPDQLWVDIAGSGQTPEQTIEVEVHDDERGHPAGGLWTSTHEDGTSPNVRTMLALVDGFLPVVRRPAWLLTPEEAIVYEIEDRSAQLDLAAMAPGKPIWPQMTRIVDGVHMTAQGALAFLRTPGSKDPRLSRHLRVLTELQAAQGTHPLDLWESERTIWFRWCFSDAKKVADVTVPLFPEEAFPEDAVGSTSGK